jgi:hypothetical protein
MYLQQNKWSRVKKTNYKGDIYDSGFEGNYAFELDMRVKAGEIVKWERQVKIPLDVNGYHIANYYIDFIAYYPDGTIEYIETKGYPTEIWKMKFKIFEALYSEKPNVKILLVQQKTNWTMRHAKKLKN